jgi:hypothetical protein
MHKAGDAPKQHRRSKADRVHRVLGVGLANRSRMFLKPAPKSHDRHLPNVSALIPCNIQLPGSFDVEGRGGTHGYSESPAYWNAFRTVTGVTPPES